MSPEIYSVLSVASRWIFAFFAFMLLFFAFSWHHTERKNQRSRFKNLPSAGTVGELIVLSGSDDLPPGTWFPVPREGILGSLRSCDLVVPCSGVRTQHLDFSWQDGTGLLIRPRIGCEALVNGIPVSRRRNQADTPMLHGSVLQIGSAVLQLQLFSALSNTNRTFTPQVPAPSQVPGPWAPPYPAPVQDPSAAVQNWGPQPDPGSSVPEQPLPPQAYFPQEQPDQLVPVQEQEQQVPERPRRSRADRWKEDWSE